MRSSRVSKFAALLLLITGSLTLSANANNLPSRISYLSSNCDSNTLTAAAVTVLPMGGQTGEATAAGYHQPVHSDNALIKATDTANSVHAGEDEMACDGLAKQAANSKFHVEEDTKSPALTAALGSYIDKTNVIPLPAAAWLFSFALLGFVVVANRRKV